VLWLYEGAPGASPANLRAQAAGPGSTSGRLVFAAPAPHAEHLARQALADLVLDTWPYGAHTTASDALRMGVPRSDLARQELRQPRGRQPADGSGACRT
jgi:protein O-GlcNAc transferase